MRDVKRYDHRVVSIRSGSLALRTRLDSLFKEIGGKLEEIEEEGYELVAVQPALEEDRMYLFFKRPVGT